MKRPRASVFLILLLSLGCSTSCIASPIYLGYFDFESRDTTNAFVLNNLTGAGAGCNADFASCSSVNFSSLELDIIRADGTQFVVNPSGIIAAGNSLDLFETLFSDSFSSARLTGKINATSLLLADGSTMPVADIFDVTLLPDPQSGNFSLTPDTDLALLSVNPASATTPEPQTGLLVLSALIAIFFFHIAKVRVRGDCGHSSLR